MLSILNDLMEHRDHVYRQGSNTAVIRVVENAHRGTFYSPDSHTAILAGGTWRPILQSSNLAAFSPGDEHYVTGEDDGKTYRVKLGSLAFGGPDKRTLFIGARSSLYSIRTTAPGR